MIESKKNREAFEEIITRWAKHTKVDQWLRDGDILNLVSSLMGELYHVTLTCGHQVKELNEGIDIEFEDNRIDENGAYKCKVSSCVCKDCLRDYSKFPKFRRSK